MRIRIEGFVETVIHLLQHLSLHFFPSFLGRYAGVGTQPGIRKDRIRLHVYTITAAGFIRAYHIEVYRFAVQLFIQVAIPYIELGYIAVNINHRVIVVHLLLTLQGYPAFGLCCFRNSDDVRAGSKLFISIRRLNNEVHLAAILR